MKAYDQGCTACPWEAEIWAEPGFHPPCPACGGPTERRWKTIGVTADGIPGGRYIENLGVTVYSKSEMKRVAAQQGLEQRVSHVGEKGSDKSPHTTKWS